MRAGAIGCRAVVAFWLLGCPFVEAQSDGVPRESIGATERIAFTQLKHSLEERAADDVLLQFQELLDLSGRKLIEFERVGSEGSEFVTYWPLVSYLPHYLLDFLQRDASLLRGYRQREDRLAEVALRRSLAQDDFSMARLNADRFAATTHGADALLILAELAARRGWFQTARAALLRLGPPWAIVGTDPAGRRPPLAQPWSHFPEIAAARIAEAAAEEAPRLPLQPIEVSVDRSPVTRAAIANLALSERVRDAALELSVARQLDLLDERDAAALADQFQFDEAASGEVDSGGRMRTGPRFAFLWSEELRPLPHRTDHADPNAVPVARGDAPFYGGTAIHDGNLILHTGTELTGFDLESGRRWPLPDEAQPFFASGYQPGDVFIGNDQQTYGWPCFDVSIAGRLLLTRFGPEVTGWSPRGDVDAVSYSRQFAFDLQREGALLEGYPLSPPEGEDLVWEWESAPVIVGDLALASVLARGPSGIRSRLIAWRIATAEIVWQTPILAEASAAVHDAHRSSCSIPVVSEGKVIHCSSLGSVSAIDLADGQLLWTTTYPRRELAASRYRHRRRAAFRYRVKPFVVDGLVVIAAADSDRLFALDAASGRLRWSTAPGVAADVMSLLDTGTGRLLASGDVLYSISTRTGVIQSVYPALPSSTPGAALPTPRAVGSPAADGEFYYWPTEDKILVFSLAPDSQATRPAAILDLAATRTPSGNLKVFRDKLVIHSGRQLTVFHINRQDLRDG